MKKEVKAFETIKVSALKITKAQQKQLKGGNDIVTEDLIDG